MTLSGRILITIYEFESWAGWKRETFSKLKCIHTMETILMDFTLTQKCSETIYYNEGNVV